MRNSETAQTAALLTTHDCKSAMRRGCATCGTFWLPWLPLASSLAVPDSTIVAIRYQDAGWMWKLVRQSSEWSTIHCSDDGGVPSLYNSIGSAGSSLLRPKLTVRIVMPFRGESKSGLDSQLKTEDSRLKTQKSKLTGCPQKALRRYRRKSQRVSRLLCWLLTQNHASTFAKVRHSVSSANSRQQNPMGLQ